MRLTWISNILDQKSLVIMSLPTALFGFIPSKVINDLDDLFFIIIGWIISMLLTIIEYSTSHTEDIKAKKAQRKELFSKMLIYTMLFFGLKFFHLWVSFGDHDYISSVVYFIVMSVYALVMLGEFKFIGENIKHKYGRKPSVFQFLERVEKAISDKVVKRFESTCNLYDDKEDIKTI